MTEARKHSLERVGMVWEVRSRSLLSNRKLGRYSPQWRPKEAAAGIDEALGCCNLLPYRSVDNQPEWCADQDGGEDWIRPGFDLRQLAHEAPTQVALPPVMTNNDVAVLNPITNISTKGRLITLQRSDLRPLEENVQETRLCSRAMTPKLPFPSCNSERDTPWRQKIDALVQYNREHGHMSVPNRYTPDMALGQWVKNLR